MTEPFPVVQDATCTDTPDVKADRTVGGLVAYRRSLRDLQGSAPTTVTIDGHAGTTVDVTVAPGSGARCPDASGAALSLLARTDGRNAYGYGIAAGERLRLTFLDLGAGHVVAVGIDSNDPATFDALAASAEPIVDPFHFK